MTFTLYELILSAGIIQGFIASLFMMLTRQFQPHQRLLGLIVLIFALVCLRILIYKIGWYQLHWIHYIPLGLELLLAPLVYFYFCLITSVGQLSKPKYAWHLILPLLWLVYDFLLYFMTLMQPDLSAQDQIAQRLYYHNMNQLEDKLILLSTWFYLILGVRRYLAFSRSLQQINHAKSNVLNRWLLQILCWMVLLALFLLVNNVFDLLEFQTEFRQQRWLGFSLYLTVTTYYLSLLGLRLQSPKLYEAIQSVKLQQSKSSGLNTDELKQQLNQYVFIDKHFKNPDLSIQKVAEDLSMPAEHISFLLNRQLKTTFRDWLNQYRIKDVQVELLKISNQQKLSNHSILDIALSSGFNSQASFYRAFKKFVGSTPRQFIETNNK